MDTHKSIKHFSALNFTTGIKEQIFKLFGEVTSKVAENDGRIKKIVNKLNELHIALALNPDEPLIPWKYDLQGHVQQINSAVNNLCYKLYPKPEKVETLEAFYVTLNALQSQMDTLLILLERDLSSVVKKAQELKGTNTELAKKVAELQNEVAQLKTQLGNVQSQNKLLETKLESTYQQFEEQLQLEDEIEALERENLTCHEENEDLKNFIKELQQHNRQLEEHSNALSEKLKNKHSAWMRLLKGKTKKPNKKTEKDDSSENTRDMSCGLCCTNTRNVIFQPCMHCYCCEQCSKKVKKCPLCREIITERNNIFFG